MEELKFGRLERVSLEDMWNGDGREFLGWLAREENLTYLGDLLNTSLHPDTMTEDKLRKDPMLVCLDRTTNARYVILSPVVKTEDRGLGRLVVYAANFAPVNFILMAGKFHPSHTKALSWLNSVTNNDLSLYAMEVEFWRIGNSALAPNFSMVINPGGAAAVSAPPATQAEPVDLVDLSPVEDMDEEIFQPETGTLARLDSVFPSDTDEEDAEAARPEEDAEAARPEEDAEAARPEEDAEAARPEEDAEAARPEEDAEAARPQEGMLGSPARQLETMPENAAESPITPSGMRKMFSSRRFSETVTGEEPKEQKTPPQNIPPNMPNEAPPQSQGNGQDVALRETSPIGQNGDSTDENHPAPPDAAADWDSLQQSSALEDAETDYPDVETTITPSGMLQRLQVRDSKTIAEATAGTNSKQVVSSEEYIEFWNQFLRDVIVFDGDQPSERNMSQGWISFPFDRENFSLVAFLNKTHGLGGIGLVIDGPECKSHYASLLQDRGQIEGEVGVPLDWRELPEKDESHIYLHRKNVDISNRAYWMEYQNWFADALEAFMRVFGNRIETLGSSIMWGD